MGIATLGRGSDFGEIALLEDRARTATLTALTPMVVEVSGRSGFALALAEVPGLSDDLRDAMARRLHQLAGDTAQYNRPRELPGRAGPPPPPVPSAAVTPALPWAS